MHKIQQKILKLAESQNLASLTLRKIGQMIHEPGSPQKIKHHLNKLVENGLLIMSVDGKRIKKISSGINDKTKLISLPIYGSANCGQALEIADNYIQGYLKVSKSILGPKLIKKIKNLFVVKAVGSSMNKANVDDKNIEDGDYVIIDETQKIPHNDDYVVSLIDGAANIKKIFMDNEKQQIVLLSESTFNIIPIYIHEHDLNDYSICGTVVKVMKGPDEFKSWQNVAGIDTLKNLGKMSEKEYQYYMNL